MIKERKSMAECWSHSSFYLPWWPPSVLMSPQRSERHHRNSPHVAVCCCWFCWTEGSSLLEAFTNWTQPHIIITLTRHSGLKHSGGAEVMGCWGLIRKTHQQQEITSPAEEQAPQESELILCFLNWFVNFAYFYLLFRHFHARLWGGEQSNHCKTIFTRTPTNCTALTFTAWGRFVLTAPAATLSVFAVFPSLPPAQTNWTNAVSSSTEPPTVLSVRSDKEYTKTS